MCLTPMEFEHFWDTPPNNLLSRLKHRGGGMLKILRLTRQIIGTFYSPRGGLVGGGVELFRPQKCSVYFWCF